MNKRFIYCKEGKQVGNRVYIRESYRRIEQRTVVGFLSLNYFSGVSDSVSGSYQWINKILILVLGIVPKTIRCTRSGTNWKVEVRVVREVSRDEVGLAGKGGRRSWTIGKTGGWIEGLTIDKEGSLEGFHSELVPSEVNFILPHLFQSISQTHTLKDPPLPHKNHKKTNRLGVKWWDILSLNS